MAGHQVLLLSPVEMEVTSVHCAVASPTRDGSTVTAKSNKVASSVFKLAAAVRRTRHRSAATEPTGTERARVPWLDGGCGHVRREKPASSL